MRLDLTSEIFLNLSETVEFLISEQIVEAVKICTRCGGASAKLSTYKENNFISVVYRCTINSCRRRQSFYKTKIPLNKVILFIYLLMADVNYRQFYLFFGISDSTTARIKQRVIRSCKHFIEDHPIYIGGPGITVHLDETVLSRRGIIRNPTSTEDDRRDTVWILGGIDTTDQKNFFITRVINRRVETMRPIIEEKVRVGSVLNTDGYPSYPQIAADLSLSHNVVYHNQGFRNLDGEHTNNIEAFWSHLKSQMRKENGVRRDNIDDWLLYYTFKRRYLINCSRDEFFEKFKEILKYYFNLN